VDGTSKDDLKQNLAWAFSFGFPVSRQLGVKMSYIGTRTQESMPVDSDTFIVGLSEFW
jgi:hypothetical protein